MVAMIGLLTALLGAIYALQLTPVYTAKSTLLIDTNQKNIINAEAIVSGIGRDNSALESELELIRSYDVAKRVVRKLKLDDRSKAEASKVSAVRQLISLVFSREPAPEPVLNENHTDRIIRSLSKSITVDRKGWTYVVDINYTSDNPVKAAQVANAFADEYLVDQLEASYEVTRRANDWLSERLGDLRKKVRESERAVELFKVENNIVQTNGSTLNDQQVAKLNEQLILARAESAQAKARYDQVQAVRKRGGDITAFADALQSSALASLKGKASEIRRELANLSAKYGDRHPSVVSARAQLQDVRRSISSEAKRILTSTENALQVAGSREKSIAASLAEVKGTASRDGQAEVILRELERESAANKALFESFLGRFKQTSEQEKLNTNNSRVIERAAAPTTPSAPNKKSIVILATMLGLGLGAGLAFLLEQLDAGYRTTIQIEKQLGVPVLASIPRSDGELPGSGIGRVARKYNPFGLLPGLFRKGDKSERRMGKNDRVSISRLVVQKPLSSFTEGIRALRMGIKFADIDRPQKIVLLASALPSEGKSTIASNLALHAAASGERVLIIDLDLRHPVLTSLYAPDAKHGAVELLLGEVDLKQVIVKDAASGLHILPAPRRKDLTHTAELLGSKRMKDLFTHLSGFYDLIVVDTSPLLPVTDGRALIDAVDSLVLVVKWETTARDAVDAALKQSLGAHAKLTGVVMNDVVASRARYYDYYKSGYYSKKYPYYYGGSG
jgi:exopolysaccharide transport family protein